MRFPEVALRLPDRVEDVLVLREEAASVLREYAERGGEIYNARRGGP